jgi:hypothetical protein
MSAPYVFVGIGDALNANSVRVYPNPTSGTIILDGNGLEHRSFEIRVFNAMGKNVLSLHDAFSFDLSSLDAGFYYLMILTDRMEKINKKIILAK